MLDGYYLVCHTRVSPRPL